MFERFTPNARAIVMNAHNVLVRLGHEQITTEHLLYGVAAEGEGIGARVLAGLGIDARRIEALLEERYGRGELPNPGQVPFTRRAQQAVGRAAVVADELGHAAVGTEHVLIALASDAESGAATALASFGAGDVRAAVLRALSGGD